MNRHRIASGATLLFSIATGCSLATGWATDPGMLAAAGVAPGFASGPDRHYIVVSSETCDEKQVRLYLDQHPPWDVVLQGGCADAFSSNENPARCVRCDAPGTNVEITTEVISGLQPPGYQLHGPATCGPYWEGECFKELTAGWFCHDMQMQGENCATIVEWWVQSAQP